MAPDRKRSEAYDRLHVVYAVPVNEGRGVYYTASDDGGLTWSEALQVFDAAGAGWAAVDYPRLAVDPLGVLHAIWIRTSLSADTASLGVYYAFSADGGEGWSEPLMVAEGDYVWPSVVTDGMGGVHLFWNQATGARSWWHQWSPADPVVLGVGRDVPAGWVRAARIPGLSDVEGPLAIVGDGALGLQVVGLGFDRRVSLRCSIRPGSPRCRVRRTARGQRCRPTGSGVCWRPTGLVRRR